MSGAALPAFVDEAYTPQTLPTSETVVRYWDSYRSRNAIKLKPGEFAVSTSEEVLVTVLGTSVAVCLRDRSSNLAGMVHFMIPISGLSFLDESTRFLAEEYGYFAFTRLVSAMEEKGGNRDTLEASVVGGARY